MEIAIVGRGRLGASLGEAARRSGHATSLLRRSSATASEDGSTREAALSPELDWSAFDLVILAFESKVATVEEWQADPDLREISRIPASVPIASVVMRPSPAVIDAALPDHAVAHFLSTPALQLSGAIAISKKGASAASELKRALADLHWVDAEPEEFLRLGILTTGSAMATAAIGYLVRLRGGELSGAEIDLLPHVLDDAKRLLALNDGDGFRAFSSVATPGGITEGLHNSIFESKWPGDE